MGDGGNTSFWEENWVGDQCLKNKFPRLFNLCNEKESSVRDRGVWEGEYWE